MILSIAAAFVQVLEREKDKESQTQSEESMTADNQQTMDSDEGHRTKLAAEACVKSDLVLDDQLEWISNVDEVAEAIDFFYQKTGIQPYLLICDSLDGIGGEITDEEAENLLDGLYSNLYEDEGHMIFVFMEYEESQYITFLFTGSDADTLMDAEAKEIFLTLADRYYTDSALSDEAYFAKIFRDAAQTIMEK